jgi:hypothetical protein
MTADLLLPQPEATRGVHAIWSSICIAPTHHLLDKPSAKANAGRREEERAEGKAHDEVAGIDRHRKRETEDAAAMLTRKPEACAARTKYREMALKKDESYVPIQFSHEDQDYPFLARRTTGLRGSMCAVRLLICTR